jgi:hypothetical protein
MTNRVIVDTRLRAAPLQEIALTVRPGAVVYVRLEVEEITIEAPTPGPRLVLVPRQGQNRDASGAAYFRNQRVAPFATNTRGNLEVFPSFRLDAIQNQPILVPWAADIIAEAPLGADGLLWEFSIASFERDDCEEGADVQRAALVPRDRRTYTLTDRVENGDLFAGPSNLTSTPTVGTVRPYAQGSRVFRVHGPSPVTLNFVDRSPPARSMIVAPGELVTVSDASYFEVRCSPAEDFWIEWEVDLL